MKYALYLGCIIPTRLIGYEISSRKVCEKLGIELVDLEDYICCGTPIKNISHKTWLAMAAYNLALAEEKKLDILTLCNGCANSLRMANAKLKASPELKKEINEILKKLGKKYEGSVEVKHLIKVLYEDVGIKGIAQKVVKPLKDLRAASHVGCHTIRPSLVMQHDDPEMPRILDELIEATGGKSLDYMYKIKCCGQPIRGVNDEASFEIAREKLKNVKAVGANCMVTVCPACNLQFDLGQLEIKSKFKEEYNIPVMHYPELLALAMGLKKEELGVETHRVKPFELLKTIKC